MLFYLVFTPSPSSHLGGDWVLPVISLLLTNTVSPVRACKIIWWERFRGTQKEDDCGPLSIQSSLICNTHSLLSSILHGSCPTRRDWRPLQRLLAVLESELYYHCMILCEHQLLEPGTDGEGRGEVYICGCVKEGVKSSMWLYIKQSPLKMRTNKYDMSTVLYDALCAAVCVLY